MKIVEPFVKPVLIEEPYKKIEYAGRICYKSQDKITDDSYIRFVESIANRGHTSVLEHEAVTLEVPYYFTDEIIRCQKVKFFEVSYSSISNCFYITGNIRAWKEYFASFEEMPPFVEEMYNTVGTRYEILFPTEVRNVPDYMRIIDFSSLSRNEIEKNFFSYKEAKKHLFLTVHILTDRATSHQIVRHRLSSFSQESQRYVNYTTDKFENTIRFVMPADVIDLDDEMEGIEEIKSSFQMSEDAYFSLIEKGVKPETARCVLPNATATELVMTSNYTQWERFIKLRSDSHAQADIRKISDVIKNDILGV